MSHQAREIMEFTKENHLNLNASKLKVIKVSRIRKNPERLEVAAVDIETTPAAKCLGVWWQHDLSASHSVYENISKARKAFFALGNISTFYRSLNPRSCRSIFETCIVPILLHGCETWLLDSSTVRRASSTKLAGDSCVSQSVTPKPW